jgi:hypothetical protein
LLFIAGLVLIFLGNYYWGKQNWKLGSLVYFGIVIIGFSLFAILFLLSDKAPEIFGEI